jgi:hypothetical protein
MSSLANEELTKTQQKTLREIQKFIDQSGFPPTMDELADRLKLTKATVHGSIDRLIQKGFLRRTPGKARSIEIRRSATASVIDMVAIPLLGDVPAGVPTNAEEQHAGQILVQASVVGRVIESCQASFAAGGSGLILRPNVLLVRIPCQTNRSTDFMSDQVSRIPERQSGGKRISIRPTPI